MNTGRIYESISVVVNPFNQNLLSANINIVSSSALKFSYIVEGKTHDTDFIYASEVFAINPIIPVIGLYPNANNLITIRLEDENGTQVTTTVYADTTAQEYGETPLSINFIIHDAEVAARTLNQGWLVTCYYTAYDKNGDLRMAFADAWDNNNLKSDGSSVYPGLDIFATSGETYAQQLAQMNLLGDIRQRYQAPVGNGFHHDVTFDPDGNMFCLVTLLGFVE